MSENAQKTSETGHVLIALAALIWGSIGVIVRILPMSALVIVEYRVLLALPFFLLLWLRRKGIYEVCHGNHSKLLVASGVVQAISWTAFFTAFKLTGIANAVVLLYIAPIIVAMLAPYLLSECRHPRAYISLFIATIGIIFIFAREGLGERLEALGIASAILAGFSFAFVIISDKRLSQNYSSNSIVTMQLLVAAILLSPSLLIEGGLPSYYEAGLLLTLGVVHTGLGLYLYLEGLRSTPAQHAVIIQYLEPTSAFFYAAILLSEVPETLSLIGGILIIAANLILVIKQPGQV